MKILMVCLGNICRSPLAQGIMESKLYKYGLDWEVDSSGTSAWHIGERPDSRSVDIAEKNNIRINNQRARQFIREDLYRFDLILAMDTENYNQIKKLAGPEHAHKIKMILQYLYPGENRIVPDPYYDGGFQHVFDLLDNACEEIVKHHSKQTEN